jgi:hypothetical protein
MSKLYLSVDCGGSQTKFIYQLAGQSDPQYELMSPLVEEINAEKLANYLDRKASIGSPAPRQEAYLTWQDRVFVVGDLAVRFDPEDRTSEQKYENALYKVAAAIGVIVDKSNLKLGKKKIELHLGVLLPWNEYTDREIFESRLRSILASFNFRGTSIACNLASILVRPEGGGVAASYIRLQDNDWLHSNKLAVLMFGHRNVSSLYFEYGKLTGTSPLFGFVNFLDLVIEKKSGLDREVLSNAIIDALHLAYDNTHKQDNLYNRSPNWIDYQPIKNLSKAKDSQLREIEQKSINSTLDSAELEYWDKIEKWLLKTLPPDLDTVILNGGATRFLESYLERYFNACHDCQKAHYYSKPTRTGKYIPIDENLPMPNIIWSKNFLESINKKFNIDARKDSQSIAIRLADCYGLFDYLLAQAESENVKKTA